MTRRKRCRSMLNKKPPMTFEYDGKTYHLIPWFDNVLDYLEVVEDCTVYESVALFLHFFVQEKVPVDVDIFTEAQRVLFGESKKQGENYVDFKQDAARIYAAFRQAYGIDLHEEHGKMHWHVFLALLGNLPSDTAFSEVVNIRQRKLPKLTEYNREEYMELVQLKEKYRIHKTDEQKKKSMNDAWGRVFHALKG